MTSTVEALCRFFGGFGIPAYQEDAVPEYDANNRKVKPPYITVQPLTPSWTASVPFYARVWYRDSKNDAIDAMVDRIGAAIGEGVGIPTDSGAVYIFKGDTFAQHQSMSGDITLKCVYLSMTIMAHTD